MCLSTTETFSSKECWILPEEDAAPNHSRKASLDAINKRNLFRNQLAGVQVSPTQRVSTRNLSTQSQKVL